MWVGSLGLALVYPFRVCSSMDRKNHFPTGWSNKKSELFVGQNRLHIFIFFSPRTREVRQGTPKSIFKQLSGWIPTTKPQ